MHPQGVKWGLISLSHLEKSVIKSRRAAAIFHFVFAPLRKSGFVLGYMETLTWLHPCEPSVETGWIGPVCILCVDSANLFLWAQSFIQVAETLSWNLTVFGQEIPKFVRKRKSQNFILAALLIKGHTSLVYPIFQKQNIWDSVWLNRGHFPLYFKNKCIE